MCTSYLVQLLYQQISRGLGTQRILGGMSGDRKADSPPGIAGGDTLPPPGDDSLDTVLDTVGYGRWQLLTFAMNGFGEDRYGHVFKTYGELPIICNIT